MTPLVDPGTGVATVGAVAGGVVLGTVSGLTPGVHANNFALVLAAVAPAVPVAPSTLSAAILAAGVVHTFLDVVPALALGVPDAAMAASALPGHRMVLAGRGREALRLSALGSGLAVCLALPMAVPVTRAISAVYPALRSWLPVLLGGVVVLLVVTESSTRAAVGGAVAFALSATLGALVLDLTPDAPLGVGGVLAPLFAGLFGAPVLLAALSGGGPPPQEDAAVGMPRLDLAITSLSGTVAGALVGYLPGVSAGVAATLSLPAVPGRSGARGFLVATSGANTANTVFALFALAALGTPRTGVLVALSTVADPSLSLLVPTVVLAGSAGAVFVVVLGDRYLRWVRRVNHRRLVVATLCLLVGVAVLFAGGVGVLILTVAAVVGLVPPRTGARRVHLMGVLLGPVVLGL